MVKVCHVNDLPEKSAKVVMVHDTPIAVFNVEGKIFAWDNRITGGWLYNRQNCAVQISFMGI